MAEKNNNDFPFEIKKVDPEEIANMKTLFKGKYSTFNRTAKIFDLTFHFSTNFRALKILNHNLQENNVSLDILTLMIWQTYEYVRVGPKGYFLPEMYAADATQYYNMPVRPSDVFVVTFPRSGTTWTQELVWLVANDLDYEKAAASPIVKRFPYLEFSMLISPRLPEDLKPQISKETYENLVQFSKPPMDLLAAAPSPRFLKTHLPLFLLPPALLTARVVFVARDPRDVAVSFYHLSRLLKLYEYVGDFKTYWNFFINDSIQYTPFFEYIKEGWEKRHHPNFLFLFYEELVKDLPGSIQKVAKFLDKQITEEQEAKLIDHLSLENFKKNKSVNGDVYKDLGIVKPDEQSFIRKGKTGGWRDYFDEEMTRQAERWIADNLRDTDLRFPQ